MIAWPEELITSIARRRSVVFVGAGASMNSKNAAGESPPSWQAFLSEGIERCEGKTRELKKLLSRGEYLTCCQLLKYKLGHDWIPFVEEKFLNPQYKHAAIHEKIFALDSSIVVTPNFDKIYDNFAIAQGNNLPKVKMYYDQDIPRVLRGSEKQRLILKIHGCIDTPDRLVFTREDYANIRNKYANFYRSMDALIFTHAFVFIGCGMNDPDIMLLLEQYARAFSAAPPHFMTTADSFSSEYQRLLTTNYNLRLLRYSSANDHQELLDSMIALVDAVEVRRQELANSTLW